MVIRTILEDRMLQAELPGFRDYVQQVRSPPPSRCVVRGTLVLS
jgi:protein-S-isoprenylcysteine O-methyltransferase Ste14